MKANTGQREIRDGTLTIRVSDDGSSCTVALLGELDLANTATLSAALEQVATEDGPSLTIDLSQLEFIDSTGIALLVATHRRLEGSDRLSLVPSRSRAVRRVMALTGLDAELPFAAGDANGAERVA